jgi:hypothetical protein
LTHDSGQPAANEVDNVRDLLYISEKLFCALVFRATREKRLNVNYEIITHSVLLPRFINTVPIFDIAYSTNECLNLCIDVCHCLTSESPLVCSFIRQAILHGQADSIIGRDVLNCCLRYHVKINEVMTLAFRHHNIDKFITLFDDSTTIAD